MMHAQKTHGFFFILLFSVSLGDQRLVVMLSAFPFNGIYQTGEKVVGNGENHHRYIV